MITEEQRLSDWLHEQTPDPPAWIDLTTLLDRSREDVASAPRSPRRWVPLLAAVAAIAVLAAVLAALPGRGHDSTPATPSPTPTGRRSTPTPGPTPTPDGLTFRPWQARLIVNDDAVSQRLAAIGSFLYRISGDLQRIEPTTGRIEAQQPVVSDTSSSVVGAAHRVWTVAPTGAHSVTLTGRDPLSLRQLVRYRFGVTGREVDGPDDGPGLAALGATLYIGEGNRVLVVDGSTGRLTSSFEVSGGVISLSANPNGSRIVVASGGHSAQGVIEVLDARNGHSLSRRLVDGCASIQAVSGGYFATCGQGMEDQVAFYPFDGSPIPEFDGGGGIPASAQFSGGVLWLGGPHEAACLDPDSGRIRAHVNLAQRTRSAALTGFSVVRGRLYAVYLGTNNTSGSGLVELTPPKACGLK